MPHSPNRPLIKLVFLLSFLWQVLLGSTAWAQNKEYSSKNGEFTFSAPSAFRAITPVPANTLLALEVPGSGVSILAERQEVVELEIDQFAEEMKKKLSESGAKIRGSAKAELGSRPAVSFLVGGVKSGKESLFIFNQRADHTYLFVLNYPEGSRQDAAELWQDIGPSIKFRPTKAKPPSNP